MIVCAGRENAAVYPVECFCWKTVSSFAQICSELYVSFHVQVSSEHPGMAAGRARLTGIPMINKEVVLPRQGSDAPIMAL